MSGHSKWATIKHQKGAKDKVRAKVFAKVLRQVEVAAREGGGDMNANASLRTMYQKARDASVPVDTIERAIKRGTGDLEGVIYESITYEGYAPGGIAVLVDVLTDNRNRTGSEIRFAFSKHGGNLGEPGSVAYLFDKQGVVVVDAERYSEDDLMPAIEAGAEDIAAEEGILEITTEPADLTAVRAALEEAEIELQSAEIAWLPSVRVPVAEDDAAKLMRLIDALEDNDDVDSVHANFDIDAEVLERVAG